MARPLRSHRGRSVTVIDRGGPVLVKKVVLAYSGGLDTSVAVAWLKEQYDTEVVTLTVDLGGGSLRQGVEQRAMSAGASRAYVVDAREPFVTDSVWPPPQANALYRQGQRPGPLRCRDACARSGARGRRADARRDGLDPRPGDRLRERARHRDPDHQGQPVL